MKNTIFIIAIFFLNSFEVSAQFNLNDYKYVIVEDQFHFQNEANEYKLNGLVRYLFRKHGFTAIIEGETLPEDMINNYCLALTSEVKVKGALRTKAQIILKDCQNNVVFMSAEGVTKEKDFARAYDLAIRKAFESFEGLNYRFIAKETEDSSKATSEANTSVNDMTKDETTVDMPTKRIKKPVINDKEASEETDGSPKAVVNELNANKTFTAEVTNNGYQLIDNITKDVTYKIYKTDLDGIFLVQSGGMIYKKGRFWVHEYIVEGEAKTVTLDISF